MARRLVGTVLVVDDDENLLSSMRRGFRVERRNVFTTTDPLTACRLAKREQPDLAVVDMKLKSTNGIELVRTLKHDYPDMILVLMSGYMSVAFAVEAVKAGADVVVFKPISVREILSRAETATESEAVFTREPNVLHMRPSLARIEYEHITRVLADCDGNISMAAKQLRIRRQSLQRRMKKQAPKI